MAQSGAKRGIWVRMRSHVDTRRRGGMSGDSMRPSMDMGGNMMEKIQNIQNEDGYDV